MFARALESRKHNFFYLSYNIDDGAAGAKSEVHDVTYIVLLTQVSDGLNV